MAFCVQVVDATGEPTPDVAVSLGFTRFIDGGVTDNLYTDSSGCAWFDLDDRRDGQECKIFIKGHNYGTTCYEAGGSVTVNYR